MSHTREFSKYEGVAWDEPNNKWVARWNGSHLGLYDEEMEAAIAVQELKDKTA
ncbi:hypothetical protein [Costertonia aggregata]|uniref:DUF2188 domain-containing protein n=1 Tax=Costertonia aggregata TaxID=343403 RepID=A0A7H9ARD0_9FLAO|nr:hypothetical protein [Costertonia aggregata]QLG46038.1 hypothetical protein HYG79_12015 [Costertonia aggregata]